MGSPRKLRREWSRPLRPFDRVRIEYEAGLKKEYGFKKKSEIWNLQNYFKDLKRRARNIQATHDQNDEKVLKAKLLRYGFAKGEFTLDDILNLRLEDVCERRLQTIILRKGMATTADQARQFVTHRRILIGDVIVDQPNYLVDIEQEKKIHLKEKKPKPAAKAAEKSAEAPAAEAAPEAKVEEVKAEPKASE